MSTKLADIGEDPHFDDGEDDRQHKAHSQQRIERPGVMADEAPGRRGGLWWAARVGKLDQRGVSSQVKNQFMTVLVCCGLSRGDTREAR